MALVLLCIVLSEDPEIALVRGKLSSRLRFPTMKASRTLLPAVVHADRSVGQDAARLVYAGSGRNVPQGRPSVLFNPFFYPHRSEAVANDLVGSWLSVHMELNIFRQPLLGMALL